MRAGGAHVLKVVMEAGPQRMKIETMPVYLMLFAVIVKGFGKILSKFAFGGAAGERRKEA
ncbi:hypothetical protein DC363_12700 [Thalassorhabdomicrobium marinisediminis]|uniref:Uncharacterized protein n=1 Tax=Thalassorhabdomicrobium marinisediminis TaxID=2170577 RepID=A0A2T7FVI0_9RHOB|nr:hypothetical protein DC363_12700 [Thalassorhabdomicrobium marinisediminis]